MQAAEPDMKCEACFLHGLKAKHGVHTQMMPASLQMSKVHETHGLCPADGQIIAWSAPR